MYQPETYAAALAWMLLSMLCWGSWANTVKICPGYRFQLFYWDYIIGLIVAAVLWGVSFGSLGSGGRSFFPDLLHTDKSHIVLAMLGGMIFNVANLLLVAAIDLAGLAVAFPVGIGLALVIGAVSSYVIEPKGNPVLLFGGIALVVAAIVLDAMAYRLREKEKASPGWRGVILSLVSGVLMGSFYPFVSRAMAGTDPPGPYATTMFFVLGVALSAIPVNLSLMRWPLDKAEPVSIGGFFQAPGRWHLWCDRRSDLVYRRRAQLCRCTGARSGAGGFLLHRSRRHHGFRMLGRLFLARVRQRAHPRAGHSGLDVSLLYGWIDVSRSGSAPEINQRITRCSQSRSVSEC